jgi:hypothetical protein
MDRAARIEPVDRRTFQVRRNGRSVGDNGDPDNCLHQLDQITLAGYLMVAIKVETVLAYRGAETRGMLAIVS